jgi:hypothetical protein
MIRTKAFDCNRIEISGNLPEADDQLLIIDDAMFVSALVEAGERHGKRLVCVACLHPARPLRAILLLLDEADGAGECAGSVGFCLECYRDLSERMFHNAVVRASKDE